jgi:tetratricopeptide (TPR) repeat protein
MRVEEVQRVLESAGLAHQAGRLSEAERLYQQVLEADPTHAEAWHMLGIAKAQAGDNAGAADCIGRAIQMRPGNAGYHTNLGNVLQETRLEDAVTAYRHALALAPNLAEIHNNLGNALQRKGEIDQAIESYRRAISIRPAFPEAHFNLGNALHKKQRWDDAITAYHKALSLRPNYPDAYLNLGIALFEKGDLEQAIAAYRRALELHPDMTEAHANLGRALLRLSRHDQAIAEFTRALAMRPDQPDVEHDLGNALREAGRLDEAIGAYQRSLSTRPEFPDSHFGLGWTYLLKGDFERGWAEYEWRAKLQDAAPHTRQFSEPRWQGEDLRGRRILLHAEQGFGDTLLAFRFVPLVTARGGRVVVQCPAPLLPLLAAQSGIEQAIEDGQPIPPVDVQCPLMSLPGVFTTSLETIPATVPYIHAPLDLVEMWRKRLDESTGVINVGLAWSGKPVPPNRSVPLATLAPLAQFPGVRWHSLQVGAAATEARTPPAGMKLTDWSRQLTDFAQTAGLIANLDLMITIDTAVAHLAGAMGKPTWLMLQYAPDWRWQRSRADSPWYATMRLFRQPRPGDWGEVISRIAAELGRGR